MAIRDGGTVIRPSTGATERWTPIEAVADEYDAAVALRSRGYRCLGVIGNASHLRGSGGHTPWCSEGYAGRACRFGKVYAIDLEAPDMVALETWLIPRLRSGYYAWIFYLNLNGHQYTRKDSFRGRYSSADHHLHLSGLAGHESDNSSILRDWEAHRTGTAPSPTEDDMGPETVFNVPRLDGSGTLEAKPFKVILSQIIGKQLELQWAVGSLQDTVIGGSGTAYQSSQLRRDHGFQIDEIERRVTAHVDAKIDQLKADLLAALKPPAA